MLGNAIMLSSFQKRTLDLPIDEEVYKKKLEELIRTSRFQKRTRDVNDVEMGKSFR